MTQAQIKYILRVWTAEGITVEKMDHMKALASVTPAHHCMREVTNASYSICPRSIQTLDLPALVAS